MLGLADKSAQRGLFAALLAGDGAGLLGLIDAAIRASGWSRWR
jgi:hypothetical protein